MSAAILTDFEKDTSPESVASERPRRPAWVEIDMDRLRRNFQIIARDKPKGVRMLSVVKDDAYGHGAAAVAKTAMDCGAAFLALSSLDEAMKLRERGMQAPMLLLGERQEAELPWCVEHGLTCCVNDCAMVEKLGAAWRRARAKLSPVHLKINTGMNRYGVRWTQALRWRNGFARRNRSNWRAC